ncbi:hypothetical protein IAU60_004042 [Kwoniella sp. DSM 27419]
MTTPTSALPQAIASPANNPSQFPQAGPSSYPRPPLHQNPSGQHAGPSAAGPSRPQFQQQFASMSGLPGQGQGQSAAEQPTLHQRLLLAARQQAQAAAAANAASANANANGGGGQTEPNLPPGLPPDLAALANKHPGNRDAIMKQLQALQSSQVQRAKSGLGNPPPSNGFGTPQTAPSPANITAPSPITAPSSITAPSPSNPPSNPVLPQATTGNLGGEQPQQANGSAATSMPQQQKDFLAIQQEKMRAAQQLQFQRQQNSQQVGGSQPATPQHSTHPGQLAMPSNLVPPQAQQPGQPRPPPTPAQQRSSFINSLAAFYRSTGQTLPPAIFNDDRIGYFKVGDGYVDIVELLMTVMKSGGIMNAMQQPPDSPLWRNLVQAKGIANPLSQPVLMPKLPNSDPSIPPQSTTNPVQYIIAGYFAWLHPFETHMSKQRQAAAQRQQADPAGRPPGAMGQAANGIPPVTAPSPVTNAGTPTAMVPPSPAMSAYTSADSPAAVPAKPKNKGGRPRKNPLKPVPPPISTGSTPPVSQTSGELSAKKRKRDKKGDLMSSAENSAPTTPSVAHDPLPTQPAGQTERPSTPKRARYRVEYRPLHKNPADLGGWDASVVAATFPKNSLMQGTRPIHDLAIVDMEAILMSLRSRLPHELGYALPVLLMLSMPHPEENIQGLPLHHLREIFQEILELITEAVFGPEGYDAWQEEVGEGQSTAASLDNMTFIELEQLGRDFDFSLNEDDSPNRDQTGGQTDIILAGMNLLRNFSMFQDNQAIMASFPELFELLAIVTDTRLCRLPGQAGSKTGQPYSIIELARVRRDAICILGNIGNLVKLQSVTPQSTVSLFRLLATFLNSGFESLAIKEPIYGPINGVSVRDVPGPAVLSIPRALEAFSKLSLTDHNREVLGARVPSAELVKLFESLIKLCPVKFRQFEAMHIVEDTLGYYECLSLSLYSLVFLAPMSTRAVMRRVPGALGILLRVILDTAVQKPDFRANPYGILCRRLCEALGVLNGTSAGDASVSGGMSFSAGGIEGTGWKSASKKVEKGYLAGAEEQVLGVVMGVRGMDLPAFEELEGMCWGTD